MLDPTDFTSADALLALENQAAESVTSGLRQTMALIARTLLRLWPGDDAPIEERLAVLRAMPIERLLDSSSSLSSRIEEHLSEATEHGIQTALAQVALVATPVIADAVIDSLTLEDEPPSEALKIADDSRAALVEQVRKARVLASVAQTFSQAQNVVGVAQYGVTRVEAITRTAVNLAANAGSDRVAASDSGLVSIWRAERDACIHCLRYSGVVDRGNGYPGGLTYGKKPLTRERIKQPPLHPRCRCDQIVTTVDAQVGLSQAMRREADRSILRGFSRESESNSARIDAAKRLLNRGVQAPKSVKAYAERAIRKGEFGRGRSLPEL